MLTISRENRANFAARFVAVVDVVGQRKSVRRNGGRRTALLWAFVAGASLVIALTSFAEPDGRRRLASLLVPDQPAASEELVLDPGGDGVSAELARLRNETRLLALEKKALSMRLAMMTESRTAITGSVEGPAPRPRQSGAPPPGPADPEAVAVRIRDLPQDAAFAEAEPIGDPTVLVSEVAGIPAPVRQASPVTGLFALELGSAASIDEARSIWTELQQTAPDAAIGLVPLIAMDERNTSRLWVMAGRFADETSASQRCEMIDASGAPCAVTAREGRPLPLP